MTEFFVGQKVVCVESPEHDETDWGVETLPAKGAVYTIRSIQLFEGEEGLRLQEIVNPVLKYEVLGELSFNVNFFRPLETKSIQLFRAIAQGVSDGKPIIPDDQPIRVPAPVEGWTVESLTADIFRRSRA